jgi:glycosyltransferase involved in cell wall biosynthesis
VRVCLETTALRSKLTGIGNYTFGLARALLSGRADLDLMSFDGLRFSPLREALAQHLEAQTDGTEAIEGRLYQFARSLKPLRSVLRSAKAVRFSQAMPQLDLFHALNFLPPRETKTPCIPLIYDLSHVRHAETHPKERVDWLNGKLATLHNYPLINTISTFSADEIASVYHYPRHQIRVTHPGVKQHYFRAHHGSAPLVIANQVLQPHQYMLTVGTLEPRKNLRTVLDAYNLMKVDERKSFPLVIVGQYGWGHNDVQHAVKLREEGSLIVADYLPDQLLHSLYANATAFLFPSLYEGFGMPVAEAMACGTPVLASDIPVLREVGGDTIAFVDTLRADAWCEAIRKIISLPQSGRSIIAERASAQAQIYTWERNALATRAMYEERLS